MWRKEEGFPAVKIRINRIPGWSPIKDANVMIVSGREIAIDIFQLQPKPGPLGKARILARGRNADRG
jgi:hypothetical protein